MTNLAITFTILVPLFAVACDHRSGGAFTDSGPDELVESGRTIEWSFDDLAVDEPPPGFTPSLGEWSVEDDATAPSPGRVLVHSGTYANPEFPRILVDGYVFDDLRFAASCFPRSGAIDQACGLMFHVVDSDNYLITRANVLENNVRLYRVVDGDRREFASVDVEVGANAWHRLQVEAAGAEITVSWDDEVVLNSEDDTFPRGHIGLWTKADSVAAFDDVSVEAR